MFFNLLNLQGDQKSIDDAIEKRCKRSEEKVKNEMPQSMEGAQVAKEAEPGTLKTTLAETPSVLKMTEKTGSLQNKESLDARETTIDIKPGNTKSKLF